MLVVAFLWSILANFNKLGTANSSAIFWATATSATVSCALLFIMLYQSQIKLKRISILISVLLRPCFFGKQGLQQRLTGAVIMFIGVSIVTLF